MARTNYWEKFEEDIYYHIYNRGINRANIFTQARNYHFFLHKWIQLIHPFCEIMAYCLMPNHFHFLLQIKPASGIDPGLITRQQTSKSKLFTGNKISYNDFLEDQFKRLFSSYALAFNKQESRTGSLFQKRFKRVSVQSEWQLWHLLAYIHHNPIHHSYEKDFAAWKYSSYADLLSNTPTFLSRAKVLTWFHEDRNQSVNAFKEYHRAFKLANQVNYLD